jgi:hypothetical protein
MPKGRRTQREYLSALDAARFGGYEAEVFVDVWNELVDRREQVRVAQEIARKALERDTEIPEGEAGRDKAFRLLEQMCGDMIYLARHLQNVKV